MSKFILCSLFSLSCLALAGCAGDKREPVDASLLEYSMSLASATCADRLLDGEFTTQTERIECESEATRAVTENLEMDYAFGDLVALLAERRRQMAHLLDAGTIDGEKSRALDWEFYDSYLRELRTRERLYNAGALFIELNVCEIAGNDLRCTQTDTKQIEKQIDIAYAECDGKNSMGHFKTIESFYRCFFEEGVTPIYERNKFPHMDLVSLFAEYIIGIARRAMEGQITLREVDQNADGMNEQYHREINHRNTLRAAGDLNWRKRKCRVAGERLVCEDFGKSG